MAAAFLNKVESSIKHIEDLKISPLLLGLYVLCVILVRDLLEVFSNNMVQQKSFFFLQYPLWFITMALFSILIVHLFTGEKIIRLSKLLIFLPIMWLAPILDLILTKGAAIGYMTVNSLNDIPGKLILWTQHSPLNVYGITWGLMIELTLAMIMFAFYVYVKTRNVLKALASLVMFYALAFLMGTPSFFSVILGLIKSKWVSSSAFLHTYNSNTVISLALFLVLIIGLALFFLSYDKKKFSYFFKYLSKTRIISYLMLLNAGFWLTWFIGKGTMDWTWTAVLVYLLANFVVVLSWIFAKFVNDYFDKKEDTLSNKENPFIKWKLTKSEMIVIYSTILLLSLGMSYTISYTFFFFNVLALSVSFLYSCPPLRLKKVFLLSNLCISLAVGVVFLQGASLLESNVVLANGIGKFFILMLVASFLGSHVKDIKDFKGDKKGGVATLPTIFGERKAKIITAIILTGLFIFSVSLFNLLSLLPLAILCGFVILYIFTRKTYREVYVFLTFFVFFAVFALFLVLKLISGGLA